MRRTSINNARILLKTGVEIIPLWILHSLLEQLLKMGTIIDSLQLSGTVSVSKIRVNKRVSHWIRDSTPFPNRFRGSLSRPEARRCLRLEIAQRDRDSSSLFMIQEYIWQPI